MHSLVYPCSVNYHCRIAQGCDSGIFAGSSGRACSKHAEKRPEAGSLWLSPALPRQMRLKSHCQHLDSCNNREILPLKQRILRTTLLSVADCVSRDFTCLGCYLKIYLSSSHTTPLEARFRRAQEARNGKIKAQKATMAWRRWK